MLSILIVEDEKHTREGLLKYIPWQKIGIDKTYDAENGLQALEIANDFCPNIILTDVRMPKMNGIELSRKIRKKFPDCKIIFLSSYTDKEYLKSAIEINAVNYIEKPVDLNEVNSILKNTVYICMEEQKKEALEKTYKSIVTENFLKLNEMISFEIIQKDINLELIKNKLNEVKFDY
ncbi:MAG: response regulator, partial [Clostridiales bacterium]